MNKYTYNQLFNLIRIQQEKENQGKEPVQEYDFGGNVLRTLNNPTRSNITNTITSSFSPKIKEIPEDRSNYTYRSS
jgi:hypothetical protein